MNLTNLDMIRYARVIIVRFDDDESESILKEY